MTLPPLPPTTATCDGCGYSEVPLDAQHYVARWRILVEPDGVKEFHTLACLSTWVRRTYMDGAASAPGVSGSPAPGASSGAAEPAVPADGRAHGGSTSNEHRPGGSSSGSADGQPLLPAEERTS